MMITSPDSRRLSLKGTPGCRLASKPSQLFPLSHSMQANHSGALIGLVPNKPILSIFYFWWKFRPFTRNVRAA